jgi:hypothetical protein
MKRGKTFRCGVKRDAIEKLREGKWGVRGLAGRRRTQTFFRACAHARPEMPPPIITTWTISRVKRKRDKRIEEAGERLQCLSETKLG